MAVLRSPRLVAALLWLALALLPLRGLAAGWMVGMPVTASAVAAAAETPMPCHEMAGAATVATPHHAMPADDAGAAALPGDCPTCALCALCHGGFVHAQALPLALPPRDGTPPAIAPAAPLPAQAPDTLFRPPRARAA